MQGLGPMPDLWNQEFWSWGPAACLNRLSGWFRCSPRFENHWPSVMALSYAKRTLRSIYFWKVKSHCICNRAHKLHPEWPLVSHFYAVYFTQQPKITSELLEHVKQIQLLYDAKYIKRNIRRRLGRADNSLFMADQKKRKRKQKKWMLFNFVYSWGLETLH